MTSIQPELWIERPREALTFYGAAFVATVPHRVGDGDDLVAQLGVLGGSSLGGSETPQPTFDRRRDQPDASSWSTTRTRWSDRRWQRERVNARR